MVARAARSAERTVGAPRVQIMALAHAGQVAVLGGAAGAAVPVVRLLGMLRDRGVTYWADEALDVAALVFADRGSAVVPEAAAALCASRPLDEGDGRLAALRTRLVDCRRRLRRDDRAPGVGGPCSGPARRPSTRRSPVRSRRSVRRRPTVDPLDTA